jgi:hypothetical protein
VTVLRDGSIIRLLEVCRVEDAEPLTALLQGISDSTLDLSECKGLHAAVVQAILAFRPKIVGVPDDPFLRDRLLPALIGEPSPEAPRS